MNKFLFLPLVLAVTLLCACSSSNEETPPTLPPLLKVFECEVGDTISFAFNAFDAWEMESNTEWCLLSTDGEIFSTTINGVVGVSNVTVKVTESAPADGYAELTLTMDGESFVIVNIYPVFGMSSDISNSAYSGALRVLAAGAADYFTCEDIRCEVSLKANDAMTLKMFGAKFAENMPVTVDITLENIPCTIDSGNITFACNDTLVPLVGTLPAPNFSFSEISGSIADGTLTFDATMTRGEFSYSGTAVK